MARERTRAVCDGLRAALLTYGAPEQILTDNGKVFTGRFNHPPVEVLVDRICRESGIEHLLTQPRSPTTTGKIERFHRSMRAEFLSNRTAFVNLQAAQQALDEWVDYYNTTRPHQSLDMATPAQRFSPAAPAPLTSAPASRLGPTAPAMTGSAAECAQTASCACPGNKLASGVTTSAPAATSTSTVTCSAFGSATNSSKPLPAPAAARYETNGPYAFAKRPNHNTECQGSTDIETSAINRL